MVIIFYINSMLGKSLGLGSLYIITFFFFLESHFIANCVDTCIQRHVEECSAALLHS
jgi:hypothetical protein